MSSDPNKTVPGFVEKLHTILEDESLAGLISWSDDGESFGVHNFTEFASSVLPKRFKHSNWQSFVRQLNMYGFNKVCDAFHMSTSTSWEFRHPFFKKGREDQYHNIRRRAPKAVNSTEEAESTHGEDDKKLLSRLEEVENLVKTQAKVIEDLQRQLLATQNAQAQSHLQFSNSIHRFIDDMFLQEQEEHNALKRKRCSIMDNFIRNVNPRHPQSFNDAAPFQDMQREGNDNSLAQSHASEPKQFTVLNKTAIPHTTFVTEQQKSSPGSLSATYNYQPRDVFSSSNPKNTPCGSSSPLPCRLPRISDLDDYLPNHYSPEHTMPTENRDPFYTSRTLHPYGP